MDLLREDVFLAIWLPALAAIVANVIEIGVLKDKIRAFFQNCGRDFCVVSIGVTPVIFSSDSIFTGMKAANESPFVWAALNVALSAVIAVVIPVIRRKLASAPKRPWTDWLFPTASFLLGCLTLVLPILAMMRFGRGNDAA